MSVGLIRGVLSCNYWYRKDWFFLMNCRTRLAYPVNESEKTQGDNKVDDHKLFVLFQEPNVLLRKALLLLQLLELNPWAGLLYL